jgi:hypothetical protein
MLATAAPLMAPQAVAQRSKVPVKPCLLQHPDDVLVHNIMDECQRMAKLLKGRDERCHHR